MNISKLYQSLKSRLGAEHEARWVLEQRAGVSWSDIIAGDTDVSPEVLESVERDVEARLNGTPLSRLYGVREFWGMSFKLSEGTLDPRPDTEALVEKALERFQDKPPESILDLGTGTGCILLALLKEFPQACGVGADLSEDALETARNNAQAHDLEGRAHFVRRNWGEKINESFDLVVSNPPYIRSDVIPELDKEVQNHDPILALDGGQDGMEAYKSIFSTLPRLLNPGGRAFFEIGYDQEDDIKRLSTKYRIRIEAVHADLSGNPRVVEIISGDK